MSQYEELKNALIATGIPTCEYDWKTRPDSNYCTIQLDFQATQESCDNHHGSVSFEGSIDLYTKGEGWQDAGLVESALESVCGASWRLNSKQFDTGVHMVHREFVFEVI